ncbi:MAG: cation transporter [Candidatus Levybacteria bacterium]|nr:cation transporter [Candidatus Levybacteria bacterium]
MNNNKSKVVKKTFIIKGMHCVSCAFDIDGTLEETIGVTKAQTNYAKALLEIEFDEAILSEERIISIIQGVGYTATLHTS